MVVRFTLDTSCLFHVTNKRPEGPLVIELAEAHRQGRACVAVAAISAVENPPKGKPGPKNIAEFEAELADVGLHGLKTLSVPWIFGYAIWGKMKWPCEKSKALARDIQQIMFPTGLGAKAYDRRKNTCDVQILCAHILECRDVFVTSNIRNFMKSPAVKDGLIKLGARSIVTPGDAVAMLPGSMFAAE